jgi:hypothetical protein
MDFNRKTLRALNNPGRARTGWANTICLGLAGEMPPACRSSPPSPRCGGEVIYAPPPLYISLVIIYSKCTGRVKMNLTPGAVSTVVLADVDSGVGAVVHPEQQHPATALEREQR